MKTNFLAAIFAIFIIHGCNPADQAPKESPDKILEHIFADYKEYCFRNYPGWATYEGDHRYDDRLEDVSDKAVNSRYDSTGLMLEKANALNPDSLSPQNKVNLQLFKWMLERSLEGKQFNDHYTPIGQQNGIHIGFPQIINYQPLDSISEFRKYFARLRGFSKQVDDEIENMRLGMKTGIVQPKFIMEQTLEQMDRIINKPTDSIAFMQPAIEHKSAIPDSAMNQLKTELAGIINETIKPAYKHLRDFVANEYIPVCRNEEGIWSIPNGDKRYKYAIQYYTTTEYTADEIFEIGLKEVERITAEMEKVKNQIGFAGSLKDFFDHVRDDPKQQYTDKDKMMNDYRVILTRMDSLLPRLFGRLPKAPCELKEIEEYRAASAPQAYYYSAPEDHSRPGYFYVNTYDLPSRPKYTMTALALHEAVPGHHLQITIAQELENLPWFRKDLSVTAFVEGWGLYSESLGYETGMYEDPYQHFGALTFEVWRACRLVVDVGLHYKKWTREQAVQYLLDHSANSETDTRSEVDRYIAWPGQALAYKIGELKIKELRKKAEDQLGTAFNIKEFHDTVLENGAIPLSLLEDNVEAWIQKKQQVTP